MSEPLQSPPSEALAKAQDALSKGDIYSARRILEAEAEKGGGGEVANALGELIARQPGKSSAAEAAKWFQRAADAGYPPGHLNLALMMRVGLDGVSNDPEKVLFHLRKAAESGMPAAMTHLAVAIEGRIPSTADASTWNEPREWLEKAAAAGDANGAIALARYLDWGLGGEANPERATDVLFAAANAGSAYAMNEIGVRFQKGAGLRQDNVSAVGWFTRASQLGQTAAMVNLGNCFENGIGVLPDMRRAGESYAAAAKLNNPVAQYLLGRMFEEGRGTEVNLAFAYVNYFRAAKQGMALAVDRRDSVKLRLSQTQYETAEKLLGGGK